MTQFNFTLDGKTYKESYHGVCVPGAIHFDIAIQDQELLKRFPEHWMIIHDTRFNDNDYEYAYTWGIPGIQDGWKFTKAIAEALRNKVWDMYYGL